MVIDKIILTLAMMFSMSFALAEDWQVIPPPSHISANKAAAVTNDAGDVVFVWRNSTSEHYEIFAELKLNRDTPIFHRLPKYEIDQAEITRIDQLVDQQGNKSAGWATVVFNRVIWKMRDSDSINVGKNESLYSWVNGDRIRFIYFDNEGRELTTVFPLTGSGKAISQVSGLHFQ